ncbi:hypothetical protein [Kitasatospora mediocidica]|uniref:hypothetical protein n=1 Tax=Kitasatospora mediocidica TaxID=58352 RepID=UPI000562E9C7|nr:hypothetical protein [Kitasatospora mediocidica]
MIRHTGARRPLPDPRENWSLRLPRPQSPPAPASARRTEAAPARTGAALALDTLHVPLHVDSWAALATALDDADVPLQLGDVDVLRQAAKLSPELVRALARWIRTANASPTPLTAPDTTW